MVWLPDREVSFAGKKKAGSHVRRGDGRTVAAFTAVTSTSCAVLAIVRGQDANYDQQNYHFYTPYALFDDRLLYDIAPPFMGPPFHNPIPYLPFYWLASTAPPMLIAALLAALFGLASAPLYLL